MHALVGENGAGKSTLMKILYGVQKPDSGTIEVDGREVSFHSPSDAIEAGIGMVFQHFMLADNLTVLENVVLGAEKLYGSGDRARDRIHELARAYGFDVDPDRLVDDLGVGDRQRVEILKVLYRGAKTIILDEPTAVLVPHEVDELFDNLRGLKAEGLTVLFISHKLDEVLAVADEVTVMRRGTTIATVDPKQTTAHQLAELLVGSELPSPSTETSTVTDEVLLTVTGMTLHDTHGGRDLLSDITFTIHRGEVLGIAGVEGNGQAELVEAIMGMRKTSGTITLGTATGTEDITHWSTAQRREAGIGYIPEDRQRHGLLLDAPIWENRVLGHQTREPNVAGPFIDRKAARADTERIVAAYDVCMPSILDTLKILGPKIRVVRGNCDDCSAWPIALDFNLGGHQFHLEHIPSRAAPAGAEFFLHGHTHVPRDETLDGIRFLNPGCITRPNRGAPASYAWLRLGKDGRIEWELVRV